ncbi:rRNA maturation RNase YbeY [Candidatus Uhrbacteria bacterium RIFOXYB12_FULL_58_10]|uniref:Endoribonuclease YbeY n=1 Tax=Candidatus Uhrbacteria bacterium RIFOXYB2_FULL_57_15 TaxID=1802422 RepID=A0A1F7W687_9BACT|nr:MAG: rRNA maturation RNase YbeY [Candidatus Uhrbacteria bacterium RIFOXYB12_FULL_58_10]OGL98335.1 MAG: rRNA maturation RNase YbeY [Candidatus Uhrbacteria bacterium RIFOXYB2_FULL_57_15]OGM00208.1 MAG: rRNA maturation RNase YbeY [Candidatus Uhrbacteria bacterium RIFOXYC12_FULL_57_11]
MALITAELNQSPLKGGQRLPRRVFERALAECERALRPRVPMALSIAFIGARDMRRLNKRWRGSDRVTDVLSFEEVEEILLCYTQAKRQAMERGHSTRDEVIFLLVHGVLHVFGHDHERSVDAKRMFSIQTKILTRLGVDSRI